MYEDRERSRAANEGLEAPLPSCSETRQLASKLVEQGDILQRKGKPGASADLFVEAGRMLIQLGDLEPGADLLRRVAGMFRVSNCPEYLRSALLYTEAAEAYSRCAAFNSAAQSWQLAADTQMFKLNCPHEAIDLYELAARRFCNRRRYGEAHACFRSGSVAASRSGQEEIRTRCLILADGLKALQERMKKDSPVRHMKALAHSGTPVFLEICVQKELGIALLNEGHNESAARRLGVAARLCHANHGDPWEQVVLNVLTAIAEKKAGNGQSAKEYFRKAAWTAKRVLGDDTLTAELSHDASEVIRLLEDTRPAYESLKIPGFIVHQIHPEQRENVFGICLQAEEETPHGC